MDDFFLKQQSIIGISLFLSGFLGSYVVAKLGLNSIWLFASLSFFVSFLLLLFVEEHKLSKEGRQSFSKIFSQSKKSMKFALGHRIVLFLFFATFFMMFRDSFGGDLVWQPFLKIVGLPLFAFGILFSASALVYAIAPLCARPLLSQFSSKKNYLAFLVLVSLLLDFSVFFIDSYVFGVIMLGAMFFLISLFNPIADSYFQSFIPSNIRATVTSFNSMVIALAYAISSPLAGFIADTIGPQYTIVVGGMFLIPAFFFYVMIKDEGERK